MDKKVTAWLRALKGTPDPQRPMVILSYAVSLDGCLTMNRGAPTSLSGKESRGVTHAVRSFSDAVLIGIGTLLSDDPYLTVREVRGPDPRPVVLDSALKTPANAHIFTDNRSPLLFHSRDASSDARSKLSRAGADPVSVPGSRAGLDLVQVLKALASRNIASVMIEGGGKIVTSFLAEGLWDAVVLTVTPMFLSGYPSIRSGLLKERIKLRNPVWLQAGEDIICLGLRDAG